jgi:hypothetical protein
MLRLTSLQRHAAGIPDKSPMPKNLAKQNIL